MIKKFEETNSVIIIVNYNGATDTIQCIKSIEMCSMNFAVIIVDNYSHTSDYQCLVNNCKNAEIIRVDKNLGFAGGNNIGIKKALKYENIKNIILLNNDTEVTSNAMNIIVDNVKDGIIVTPRMLYFFDKEKVWYAGGDINKYTGRAIHHHMNENVNDFIDSEITCDFTSGCCFAISRNDLLKIGVLEESYFMYCEDTEFCLRAVNNRLIIKYLPQAVIYHKVSQSTGGGESSFCLYYMTRNRLRYLHEYREYFYSTAIPFTICTRYIRMLQYMLKGDTRWKAIRKGINDYHKNIQGKVELDI